MAENVYLRLKPFLPPSLLEGDTTSVHFLLFPTVKTEFFDEVIQRKVRRMTTVLDLTRYLRDKENISFKVPLRDLIIVHKDPQYLEDVKELEHYVKEELRLQQLTYTTDEDGHGVVYKVKADWPVLGKKLKKDMPVVKKNLEKVTSQEVKQFLKTKSIVVGGITLGEEDLQVFPYYLCYSRVDVNILVGHSGYGSSVHDTLHCKSR
jgi:isoleucyl-tRNA synthetase